MKDRGTWGQISGQSLRQPFKTETEKCDSVVCCVITREEFWLILSAASITEEEENSLC